MRADNFDLQAYFDRIGYRGAAQRDLHTLTELMRRQLFSVPFENLDVLRGKGVSLVPEAIVEKVVAGGRGGYCYELNGLFAMALEALGMPYRFVACRPMFYPVLRPRTHMALLVSLEGEEWLCDLGFGSYGIRAPLRLADAGCEVEQDGDRFLLERSPEAVYLLKAWVDGAWENQFSFDLWPQQWIDFIPANYLNSTHPDSVFVQKPLVILHTPEGRRLLFGDRLKTVHQGEIRVRQVTPEELGEVLERSFGLPF